MCDIVKFFRVMRSTKSLQNREIGRTFMVIKAVSQIGEDKKRHLKVPRIAGAVAQQYQ